MDENNEAQDAEQPNAVQDQENAKMASLLSSFPAEQQEPIAKYLESVIERRVKEQVAKEMEEMKKGMQILQE